MPRLGRYAALANAAVLAAVAALLSGTLYYILRMAAAKGEIEEVAGDEYVQRTAEEGGWRHGGLTYYNPEDPALVVEKVVGLGYTLNMAHPSGRYRLALLAGVPLFLLWALTCL